MKLLLPAVVVLLGTAPGFAPGPVLGADPQPARNATAAQPAPASTGSQPSGGNTAAKQSTLKATIARKSPTAFTVTLPDGRTMTIDSQQPGHKRATVDDVDFELTPEGSVAITARGRDLELKADAKSGWLAMAPMGQQFIARIVSTSELTDVTASTENQRRIHFQFGDGGSADMGPGSCLRYEQMNDQSYYVVGVGDVTGVTADGVKTVLDADSPPMTGGPMRQVAKTDGTAVMERTTPVVPVLVAGELGRALTLTFSERNVQLAAGERQQFTMHNGAVVDLQTNPDTKMLDWQVGKGLIEFKVEGIDGWKARARAGQEFSAQWDKGSQIVMLKNNTWSNVLCGRSILLVGLPNQATARLEPGATLQVAQMGEPGTFSTVASGAPVTLRDRQSGETLSLSSANYLFLNGRPDSGSAATAIDPGRILVTKGDAGVTLAGTFGQPTLAAGASQTIELKDGSKIEAWHERDGNLSLKVLEGQVALQTELDKSLSVELRSGNGVTISLNDKRGTVTFVAQPGNIPGGASFRIASSALATGATARAPSVELLPNMPLTVAAQRLGVRSVDEATMVFYEAAGSGVDSAGAAPIGTPTLTAREAGGGSLGIAGSQLDATRIEQPPISTLR
jgi:hypothetical protein